jgi:hypothetical protein
MEQKRILLCLAVVAVMAIVVALQPEDTSVDCGAVALYGEPNAPERNRVELEIAKGRSKKPFVARCLQCKGAQNRSFS